MADAVRYVVDFEIDDPSAMSDVVKHAVDTEIWAFAAREKAAQPELHALCINSSVDDF